MTLGRFPRDFPASGGRDFPASGERGMRNRDGDARGVMPRPGVCVDRSSAKMNDKELALTYP